MQTQYTILYKYLNEGNAITNEADYTPMNAFYTKESKINFNLTRFDDLSSAGYNLTLNNYTVSLKNQFVEKYKKEGEEEKLTSMQNAYLDKEKFKNLYLYDCAESIYSKVFIPEQTVLVGNLNNILESQRPKNENDVSKPFKFADENTVYLDSKFTELYAKEYITEETTINYKKDGTASTGSSQNYKTIIKEGTKTAIGTEKTIDATSNPKLEDYNITEAEYKRRFGDSTSASSTYIKPIINDTVFLKMTTTEDDKNNYSALNKTRANNPKGNFITNLRRDIAKELPLKVQIEGIGDNGEEPILFKSLDTVSIDDIVDNEKAWFEDKTIKAPGLYSFNGEDYVITRVIMETAISQLRDENGLSATSILKYNDNGQILNIPYSLPPSDEKDVPEKEDITIKNSEFFSYLFISTKGTNSSLPNFKDISKIGNLTVGFMSLESPNGVSSIGNGTIDVAIRMKTGSSTATPEFTNWKDNYINIANAKAGHSIPISNTAFAGMNNFIDKENYNYTHIREFTTRQLWAIKRGSNKFKEFFTESEMSDGTWYFKSKYGDTSGIKIESSNLKNITKNNFIAKSKSGGSEPPAADYKKITYLKKNVEVSYYVHIFGVPVSTLEENGFDQICKTIDIKGANISQTTLPDNEYISDSAPFFIKDVYKKIDESPWMVYSHEKSLQAAVNKCKALVKRIGIDNVKLIKNINVDNIIDVN
jgi:hypothetical protein